MFEGLFNTDVSQSETILKNKAWCEIDLSRRGKVCDWLAL